MQKNINISIEKKRERIERKIKSFEHFDFCFIHSLFSFMGKEFLRELEQDGICLTHLENLVFHIFKNIANERKRGMVPLERYKVMAGKKERKTIYMQNKWLEERGLIRIIHKWDKEYDKNFVNTYELGDTLVEKIYSVIYKFDEHAELRYRKYSDIHTQAKFKEENIINKALIPEEWVRELPNLYFSDVVELTGLFPRQARLETDKIIPMTVFNGFLFDAFYEMKYGKKEVGRKAMTPTYQAEKYGVTLRTVYLWKKRLEKNGLFIFQEGAKTTDNKMTYSITLGPILRQWLITVIIGRSKFRYRSKINRTVYGDARYNTLYHTFDEHLERKKECDEFLKENSTQIELNNSLKTEKEKRKEFFTKIYREPSTRGVPLTYEQQYNIFMKLKPKAKLKLYDIFRDRTFEYIEIHRKHKLSTKRDVEYLEYGAEYFRRSDEDRLHKEGIFINI